MYIGQKTKNKNTSPCPTKLFSFIFINLPNYRFTMSVSTLVHSRNKVNENAQCYMSWNSGLSTAPVISMVFFSG